MSHCPTCGTKLEQHRGERFEKILYAGQPHETKISGFNVKWWCPVCKKYTPSNVELMVLGRINRTVKRMTDGRNVLTDSRGSS